jgi:hypothetical protein
MDRYFLEERCPFSQKRKLKTQNVKILAVSMLILAVGFVLFFGESVENASNSDAIAVRSEEIPTQPTQLESRGTEGSISVGGGWGSAGNLVGSISMAGGGSAVSPRQYGASQIVRGGEGVGNGFGLPMGSTIAARLLNSLLSSDSAQPVIAEVAEDAAWRNSVLIPAGTKAIGTASFDDASKRLQVRFHTFVYPEGDQHPVSALALLQNGSSGLPGDYHSGATQQQVGRFLGNFVGGLADGMKDRQAGGQAGIAFEPGSLKNGILNGITVSGLDQAKAFSEGMQNVRPYLEVPGGTPFLLYFEKEYSP